MRDGGGRVNDEATRGERKNEKLLREREVGGREVSGDEGKC